MATKGLVALIAVGIVVAAAVSIAVFAMPYISGSNSRIDATRTTTTTTNRPVDDNTVKDMLVKLTMPSTKNAPALGKDTAKVTLVEFGDYQCTFCHRWHEETKNMLISNYVNTGKVKFLFKDFPINDLSDKASSLAAEASYCAADQDKYWDYHDILYKNWKGENTGWVTKESLEKFAQAVSIADMSNFSKCLSSEKYAGVVKGNYDLATSIGLDATPSFIILANGQSPKLIKGAYPYSTFESVINDMYVNSHN